MSMMAGITNRVKALIMRAVDWQLGLFYQGYQSYSGVPVGERDFIGLPGAYAAVRAISETVGQMPIRLIQRVGQRTSEITDHPVAWIIGQQPNHYMTPNEFVGIMQARLVLRHNAFALIERDGMDVVTALRPVHPGLVDTRYDARTGMIAYDVHWQDGGIERDIPPHRMLHIRGFSDDGFLGWPPLAVLRDTIGQNVASERYMQYIMANSTHIPGFLRLPNMSEKQTAQVQQALKDWRGVDHAGKMAVFPGMVEYVKVGMTMQEADILGTRRLNIEDLARMFRIPPHVIGDLSRATFSNIEEQYREFLDLTIAPWLTRWEQRLGMALLTRREREDGYRFRFDTSVLARANTKDRYDAYQSSILTGWMTRNEVRAREDLGDLPHLDEPLAPLNMAPASTLTDPPAPAPAPAMGGEPAGAAPEEEE